MRTVKKTVKKLTPDVLLKGYRHYKKHLEIKLYAGNKVVCPICKSEFKHFAPFGLVKRGNARCLNCHSLERHRLLWKYISEKTNLFENHVKPRILHFAPEKIFYDIFSQHQNIEYIPCDLFPKLFRYKGKTKIEKVDITNIPFEEHSFDVILCNHVLEHIPDDRLAMTELYRVMKKGGWGIFQVPIDYNREVTYEDFSIVTRKEREKAFGLDDHVRCYGKDYKDRLKSVGFNVTEDGYINSFSSDDQYKFGLMDSELIYFCQK
jgi:SAM-dependent methyltransferase